MTVLSLCDHSGAWSQPYRDAGYDVVQVDIKAGQDVRLFKAMPHPVRGVLAAPPCTHLSRAGAHLWKCKGEAALLDALAVVDACLRVIVAHRPQWWALENPIGRLKDYLGEPQLRFDPCDFGDPWTKRTWLWGRFNVPGGAPCAKDVHVNWTEFGRRSSAVRSVTPPGFARAFFEANP